jgi:hypothetical protein
MHYQTPVANISDIRLPTTFLAKLFFILSLISVCNSDDNSITISGEYDNSSITIVVTNISISDEIFYDINGVFGDEIIVCDGNKATEYMVKAAMRSMAETIYKPNENLLKPGGTKKYIIPTGEIMRSKSESINYVASGKGFSSYGFSLFDANNITEEGIQPLLLISIPASKSDHSNRRYYILKSNPKYKKSWWINDKNFGVPDVRGNPLH